MNLNKIRKQILKIIFITTLLFVSLFIQSQEEIRQLTLKDAIEIARQQSPDALNAKNQFRTSYWQYRSYRAEYLPALSVGAYLPNFNRTIEQVSLEQGEALLKRRFADWSIDATLLQRVGFTGGDFFLRSSFNRLDDFSKTDTTIIQQTFAPISIGYTQPIFKFNAYKWQKRIEPMLYEEAKKKYLEDMEQVALAATNRFFDLLIAQIGEKIAIINKANYDTLFQIAKGRYNLGKIAENELLQLELRYLRASSAVESQRLDVENNLFRFKSYLRIKDNIFIELTPPTEIKKLDIPVAKAIVEAKANRSDALAFNRRLLEAERNVNFAKMNDRFDAEIYAVYGLNNQSIQVLDEVIYKDQSDNQQLRVGITMPILDWGVARGKIKIAQSEQEIVQTDVEQDLIDFEQDIFLTVAQFNIQYNQVIIAAKEDTVAQKGYDVTKARYMIGKIDITDLNIAQEATDESKRNFYSTLRTYWRYYYELRYKTMFDFERDMPIMVNYKDLL